MYAIIHINRIFAALLLLLYGFIITPVTAWHSHACDAACEDSRHHPPAGEQIGKAGHACSICDHAYAPYISADEPELRGPGTSFSLTADVTVSAFSGQPGPRCSSRGSPIA